MSHHKVLHFSPLKYSSTILLDLELVERTRNIYLDVIFIYILKNHEPGSKIVCIFIEHPLVIKWRPTNKQKQFINLRNYYKKKKLVKLGKSLLNFHNFKLLFGDTTCNRQLDFVVDIDLPIS
jgi:hypothetical protein